MFIDFVPSALIFDKEWFWVKSGLGEKLRGDRDIDKELSVKSEKELDWEVEKYPQKIQKFELDLKKC